MAYIKAYEYDIFISYSHIDNQTLPSQAEGWIKRFHAELTQMIAQRIGEPDVIKIWWDDKKLDGSILFDDSIIDGIKKSAILICLTSPGYLKSNYCKMELDLFYNKARNESVGLKIGNRYVS